MTEHDLPSGGGAFERKADGSLLQVEAPTAPQDNAADGQTAPAAPVQTAVEDGLQKLVKRTVKEA